MFKMNKIAISLFSVVVAFTTLTNVSAATANERLEEYLTDGFSINGTVYEATDAQLVQLERYLDSNELTDDQVDAAITNVDKVKEIITAAGIEDLSELSLDDKADIVALVTEAGDSVGVSIAIDSAANSVVISDSEGNVLDSTTYTETTLPFTGSNISAQIITVLALVTLTAMAIFMKKSLTSVEN